MHQVSHTQFCGPDHPSSVRNQRCASAPPVCSREAQCSRGFPLPGGVSRTLPPLVGQHRPLRHFHEPPSASLLLPGGGYPSTGHRRDDPVLRRPPGLCLPSVRLYSECSGQGPPVSESGGHSRGSLLASEALVPGHPGTSSGYSSPSTAPTGLTPPASLPSFSSEPPCASHDWVSYCQRTARHLGFSSAVARQLAFCRRSSTRMNYQARWSSYRAWCRRQGHSVSLLLRSQISFFTSVALFIFPTHLSRPIALCSVLFSALSFPISPLTLFSTISCGPSELSVPYHRLVFFLWTYFVCSPFSGVLPSNPSHLIR